MHSADIEYFMGNLDTNSVYAWDAADAAVSQQMQQIYVNFVTHGNPNGAGIPAWAPVQAGETAELLCIATQSVIVADAHRPRYQMLDTMLGK